MEVQGIQSINGDVGCYGKMAFGGEMCHVRLSHSSSYRWTWINRIRNPQNVRLFILKTIGETN